MEASSRVWVHSVSDIAVLIGTGRAEDQYIYLMDHAHSAFKLDHAAVVGVEQRLGYFRRAPFL